MPMRNDQNSAHASSIAVRAQVKDNAILTAGQPGRFLTAFLAYHAILRANSPQMYLAMAVRASDQLRSTLARARTRPGPCIDWTFRATKGHSHKTSCCRSTFPHFTYLVLVDAVPPAWQRAQDAAEPACALGRPTPKLVRDNVQQGSAWKPLALLAIRLCSTSKKTAGGLVATWPQLMANQQD